jgi:hypothetical protein
LACFAELRRRTDGDDDSERREAGAANLLPDIRA